VEYKLKTPIKRVDGSTLSTLNVREEHTLGDWLWIEGSLKANNALERSAMALCRFCGLAREEVERLDMVDYYGLTRAGEQDEAKKDESATS
jgi:hypothetical protein